MNSNIDYLDRNTAAGELSRIFAIDVTAAEGQCASCGATKRFAEAHVYMQGPGPVARCAACEHVLLRLVNAPQRVWLDMRGMTYFRFCAPEVAASGG
jgi:NAD-dependent SIR2 family protein deacetylase